MDSDLRKKSPRAPSMALDDAVERVTKVYEKEGRHPTSMDVIAQGLGYKDSNNGRARSAIASLGYYGLVERMKDGKLAVSRDLETYQFAPDPSLRRSQLITWLKTPAVFADLVEKYDGRLPSDATIKYDLIVMGFSAATADSCAAIFRRSVEFAGYYDVDHGAASLELDPAPQTDERELSGPLPAVGGEVEARGNSTSVDNLAGPGPGPGSEIVRVQVRLPKGRQAWLELPVPFFEADKERIKKHIDLQLTDDEDEL